MPAHVAKTNSNWCALLASRISSLAVLLVRMMPSVFYPNLFALALTLKGQLHRLVVVVEAVAATVAVPAVLNYRSSLGPHNIGLEMDRNC